jgi:hypothetical protein
VLALNEALTSLARVDLRKSRLVELRFFGGLNVATLHGSGVSAPEWRFWACPGRARLFNGYRRPYLCPLVCARPGIGIPLLHEFGQDLHIFVPMFVPFV